MKRTHLNALVIAVLLAPWPSSAHAAATPRTTHPEPPPQTIPPEAKPNHEPAGVATADLRPKLVPGSQARYRWTFDNVDGVAMANAPGPQRTLRFIANILVRVPQEKQPAHDLELVYERITASVRTAGGPMDFDSDTPAHLDGDNALAAGYRPIVGTTLQIKIDDTGNIQNITGIESLMAVAPRMRRSRELFLEKDSVQRTFGSIFSTGRAQPQTALGESWITADKYAFSQNAVVEISNIHTLMSIEGDAATIEIRAEAKPPAPGAPATAAIRSQQAQGKGSMIWNTKAGQLHSNTIEHQVTLEFETANVVITNTARVKSTIERIE